MISCSEYDYIELVCLYNYPIRLTLKTDTVIEGVALDTVRDESRNECIKVDVKKTNTLVILSDISKLEVQVENPHFSEIAFK